MTSADVLLIILSVTLAVFLILAIILTAYLIVIAQKIKKVAENAEEASSKFAEIAGNIQKVIAPAMVSKIVSDFMAKLGKFGKSSKEKE